MPRPTKDPREHRARARQVRFTAAEELAYLQLKAAVAAGGPVVLDQQFLLWLIEQECGRRGVPWPGPPLATTSAERAPTPQEKHVP